MPRYVRRGGVCASGVEDHCGAGLQRLATVSKHLDSARECIAMHKVLCCLVCGLLFMVKNNCEACADRRSGILLVASGILRNLDRNITLPLPVHAQRQLKMIMYVYVLIKLC